MKKKIALLLGLTLGFTAISCSLPLSRAVAAETEPTNKVTMFRLYNPNSGEHFYTGNETEKTDLVKAGWRDEGIGWIAPVKSNTPVYRLYNGNAGDHHYTLDAKERDNLVSAGWKSEDIGWYSDDEKSVPLYREYNPNAVTGTHNYTTDKAEHDGLVKAGWKDEGIGWYAVSDGKTEPVKDPDDDLKIGDIIILGTYEQDNDFTNGPEPIEWQYVADRDGHKFLLSKYVLDCKQYNATNKDITWEDCSLRKWLNEDFYNNAFSVTDKKKIVTAHNENPDSYELFEGIGWNPKGADGADGGNDTDDRVFLMSWTEVEEFFDGKRIDSSDYNSRLMCRPTEYAKAQGVRALTSSDIQNVYPSDVEGCCHWLLRSPGTDDFRCTAVMAWGNMGVAQVYFDAWGVRPAILVD